MRGKDLLECMEHIDDTLIEEALEPITIPHKNNIIVKWGMAAACVIVIGISATAFWPHQNTMDKRFEYSGEDTAAPIAMDDAHSDSGSSSAASTSVNDLTTGAMTEKGMGMEAAEAARDEAINEDTAADAVSIKENTKIAEMEEESRILTEQETPKFEYIVIDDYYEERDGSDYNHPIPKKGEFICYHDLNKTMQYYAEQENAANSEDNAIYAYDVVIDVYGDIEMDRGIQYEKLNMDDIAIGNTMIEQEYRRLTELGYAVRLSEDFQLTGTFTKVEIDTFQALPEYGYVFRFANES